MTELLWRYLGTQWGTSLGCAARGRNPLIAQQTGMEPLVPCVACYSRLRHAQHAL